MIEGQRVGDLLKEFRWSLGDAKSQISIGLKAKSANSAYFYTADIARLLSKEGFEEDTVVKDPQELVDAVDREIKLMGKENIYKPRTRNRKRSTAMNFYKFLGKKEDINVPKKYKPEYEPPTVPQIITPDQFYAIMEQVPETFMGARDMAIYGIIDYSGVSLSRVIELTFRDIIRSEGKIGVRFHKEEVLLTNMISDGLQRYEELFRARKKGQPLDSEGISYFRNKHGEPMTDGRSTRRNFTLYAKKAGIRDIIFSSLRVSYAQRKIGEGEELCQLSSSMGVTMDWLENIKEYYGASNRKTVD